MPALVRLYIRHVVIGFALGLAFTAMLLWLNVGNLWHLVRATDGGTLAIAMLVIFNGIVFSGVQFGYAVMRMGASDDPTGGHRKPAGRCDVNLAALRVAEPRGRWREPQRP